ncbi:MAG TPA: translocation/assembly module TamB domain-containing protein, partial [Vicinamibacterales bacterium]|nr:translocation/assembly module TamB domain-containing protein [Vicinamibacterales bacterium]
MIEDTPSGTSRLARARASIAAAGRRLYRYGRRFAVTIGVVVAVLLVSLLTLDLGPAVKALAEREGSKWLQREMTIGRLGIHLGSGKFVVENLRIGGMFPHEPPWLEAKRLDVSLAWSALLHREVLLESIEMADWRMVVESFPDGRQTFPRLTGPPRPPRTGPRIVVTTMQYVRAHRGELVVNDYGSDWFAVAPNLEVIVTKSGDYRGQMKYSNGTVRIQKYEQMRADLSASFKFADGKLLFDRIDLITDGAESKLTGVVELNNWPEQTYQIDSLVQFPKMREIFFARDTFSLHGAGRFLGTFHYFKGGREVKGDFTSALAGVNDYRFPNFEGSVVWVRDRMEVTRARADFYGGKADFKFLMAPLGKKDQPARAVFAVNYRDVDLTQLSDFYQTSALRLAGRASGQHEMSWPLGRYVERRGAGTASFSSTADLQGPELAPGAAADARDRYLIAGPFSRHTPLTPVAIGGDVIYAFDPEMIRFEPSRVLTEHTYIAFEGATAYGERSKIPFRLTSRSWQESDRFLAGIMTTFGAPTRAIPVDGIGKFDGVMLGAFRRPRIEGHFTGAEMLAWDVNWGDIDGDFVIENAYANISRSSIRKGRSRMDVTGQFSLGYPRADGGEQIDARIRVSEFPVVDFREAFDLQDYDIDGMVTGEFHLTGEYERPHGFGSMTISRGLAYDEPFSEASASLAFYGDGVRLNAIEMKKGGGTVTGAADVAWAGSYTFNVAGRGIAVDTLTLTAFPGYPALYGSLEFTASGAGTFEEPRYDVRFSASDLFFGEEGVGELTGRLSIRGLLMSYEVEAASPRLAVSGTGRIELNDQMDAELSFRLQDTSLDPYLRAVQPTFSPFASAVASGTIRVVGELYNPDALRIDTSVEAVNVRLLDYRLRNQSPIRLSVERQVLQVDALKMVGEDTEIDLSGSVNLTDQALTLQANGAANLAVLQGFLPDIRSSGRAEVSARISGTAAAPVVAGNALLSNGRMRSLQFPHALEELNGIATFDAAGVRLDGITARIGGGAVRFGGRIGLSGYQLSEFDVTATGTDMSLRYPEGMRSVVDANLALQGPATAPLVTGVVNVKRATWARGFGASGGLFSGLAGGDPALPTVEGQVAATSNVRFDVRLLAPSTLSIDNDQARVVASADLTMRGTLDRPLLFGHAEIERGEVEFEGRRYLVTRGSLDFANANRIQPFFDIEAETRVRVPGQTYRVTMRMAGTTERMQPQFTSDPPLQTLDILTLLFSDQALSGDIELAGLQRPNEREQRLVEARATRALTGALSEEVGRVVEQTFGVDTFQITPLLSDPHNPQSSTLTLNPSARVT